MPPSMPDSAPMCAIISIIPTCVLDATKISELPCSDLQDGRFGLVGTGVSEPFGILAFSFSTYDAYA
jgi:hypothetical protein